MRPSRESQNLGQPSQDFLVFEEHSGTVVFAVCDGVGESFFGNLAASILGTALLNWLSGLKAEALSNRNLIQTGLVQFLGDITADSTKQVNDYTVTIPKASLLYTVLEEKRQYGSETVFAAGRIDLPTQKNPNGVVLLCWMGNTEIQMWRVGEAEGMPLLPNWSDKSRWSTRRGIVGELPHVEIYPLVSIHRLALYSDGLASIQKLIQNVMDDKDLIREVNRIESSPLSDDISFLEIEILPTYETFPEVFSEVEDTGDEEASNTYDSKVTHESEMMPSEESRQELLIESLLVGFVILLILALVIALSIQV